MFQNFFAGFIRITNIIFLSASIGIHNLTNVKRGDYYGLPANWNVFKRRRFGAYLLKTAASILKLEGRRPLKLNDVVALEL